MSIPCLIQINPLNGEISDNFVTGKYLGAQEFFWLFLILSVILFLYTIYKLIFYSEGVSVALR